MNINSITLLGTRGSVTMSGDAYRRYGGATSCVLADMGGELIVLDAGTGILRLGNRLGDGRRRFSVLLSHPHTDHMIGLPCLPLLFDPDVCAELYAAERGGLSAREQFGLLMRPPLWPVGLNDCAASLVFHEITGDFQIGGVTVSTMEGCHPGGSTVFRLSCGNLSVVYATDYEHGERSAELERFARGCGVLIYDAQFSGDEYESKRGWGHSTWQEGVRLAGNAGVKQLVLTHHAPFRTDSELDGFARQLDAAGLPFMCSFGKCGEEIML